MITKVSKVTCDHCGAFIAEIEGVLNVIDAVRIARRINNKMVVHRGLHFCNIACWIAFEMHRHGEQ